MNFALPFEYAPKPQIIYGDLVVGYPFDMSRRFPVNDCSVPAVVWKLRRGRKNRNLRIAANRSSAFTVKDNGLEFPGRRRRRFGHFVLAHAATTKQW
jgi:hypothetical protein